VDGKGSEFRGGGAERRKIPGPAVNRTPVLLYPIVWLPTNRILQLPGEATLGEQVPSGQQVRTTADQVYIIRNGEHSPSLSSKVGAHRDPQPAADALDSLPEWHTWFRWTPTPGSPMPRGSPHDRPTPDSGGCYGSSEDAIVDPEPSYAVVFSACPFQLGCARFRGPQPEINISTLCPENRVRYRERSVPNPDRSLRTPACVVATSLEASATRTATRLTSSKSTEFPRTALAGPLQPTATFALIFNRDSDRSMLRTLLSMALYASSTFARTATPGNARRYKTEHT
jgi:hypothetical protein